MKKKYLIALGAAIISVSCTSCTGCSRKDDSQTVDALEASMSTEGMESSESDEGEENPEESTEEETEGVVIPETTREASEELPDEAIYDDTVLDGYKLQINSAERYTINFPADYEVKPTDKYKTYLVKENTQIFVYCIDETFSKSRSVSYSLQIEDALYRFPYQIDGKDYTASVMDRGAITEEDVNGKSVIREMPSIEFASTDNKYFVKPICISYFTSFDDRGFAIIGTSTDKTEEELEAVMHDMMSTLGTYTPAKREANFEYADRWFVADDNTGISFPYPRDWTISRTKDGLVVFSAPQDNNLYDGAKIIYKSDSAHKYVEDYAQFANITDLLVPLYMQSGYQKDKMSTDFLVESMDDTCTVDGVKCLLFEIEDQLLPLNKANELLLPSSGEKIHSFRYTFNSNSIPVMVSFHYTDNNKYQMRDMADTIMKQITVR